MAQRAFMARPPALAGVMGPPKALCDANRIAKQWIAEGYVAAFDTYKAIGEAEALSRTEMYMLREKVLQRKTKLED